MLRHHLWQIVSDRPVCDFFRRLNSLITLNELMKVFKDGVKRTGTSETDRVYETVISAFPNSAKLYYLAALYCITLYTLYM